MGALPKFPVDAMRVEVTGTQGSAPREAGAFMLVWAEGQSGTIGGGVLEWNAAKRAREMLLQGALRDSQSVALGPEIGQCCGGRVELGFEMLGSEPSLKPEEISPLGREFEAALTGWQGEMPVYLYGAGHVGRAIVKALPFKVQWVDVAEGRYPDWAKHKIIKNNPAAAVAGAPDDALHFVLTHSHSFDLEICHQVLSRPFGHLGLIGSDTKKTRFLKRLRELGHGKTTLARLQCPIGDKRLGKAPEGIALGVAHWLKQRQNEGNEPLGEGHV
ncbi:MAG TPA: xanthine dehydrogenase accessory protein XdhC [Rhodobacteraceae bacterium]|nr:xanthine dehydrogenase accessory protein XdhC [Paracoccaceae bacterium]